MSRRKDFQAKKEQLREQAKHLRENYDKGFSNKEFPLDFNKLKDFNFYEVKEGVNKLSIVCYKSVTDNDPITEKGSYSHCLAVYTHKGVGINKQHTVVCPRRTFDKKCPICEDWEAEYSEVQDSKEVATPKAVCRPYYLVIDNFDPDKEIKLFQAAYEHFEKRMQSKLNSIVARGGEELIPWDDNEGNLVVFDGEKSKNYDYIEPVNFDFEEREALDLSDDDVPSLDEYMVVHNYDELKRLQHVDDSDDVPEDDHDTEAVVSDRIVRRESKRETPKVEESSGCPGKGKFGVDHNEIDGVCSNDQLCKEDIYDACKDENERLKKEKEAKPERGTSRRNR
jgi:hypothetical protein